MEKETFDILLYLSHYLKNRMSTQTAPGTSHHTEHRLAEHIIKNWQEDIKFKKEHKASTSTPRKKDL